MPTTFSVLRRACGLSQEEAADYVDVRIDTIRSWETGRREAPQGAIDSLRQLQDRIGPAGEELASVTQTIGPYLDDDGVQKYRLGLPIDEKDARACGWPTSSACHAAVAAAIAHLPLGFPVKLMPRVRGSIPTAVVQTQEKRMPLTHTADDANLLLDILHEGGKRYTSGNVDRRRYARLEQLGWLSGKTTNISDVEYSVTPAGHADMKRMLDRPGFQTSVGQPRRR